MAEFKIRDKATGEIFTIREKGTASVQEPMAQPKSDIGGIASQAGLGALSGLSMNLLDTGNKPMSEIVAGDVGANIMKGASLAKNPMEAFKRFAQGGMMSAQSIDPIQEATLAQNGFPTLPQPQGIAQQQARGFGSLAGQMASGVGLEAIGKTGILRPTSGGVMEPIDAIVKEGFSKAIRPSVKGKGTESQVQKYYRNATSAVKDIVSNPDLALPDEIGNPVKRLPQSLADMAKAVEQTRAKIYGEYHAMAEAAGDAGAKFDIRPILKKMVEAKNDKGLDPEVRTYIEKQIPSLAELANASPDIVERRMQSLNQSLTGFYEGRVQKGVAQTDASIAKLMREQLDSQIAKSQGEGYKDLKKRYGALKSVEGDINRRAIVASRANPKGFFDITDVFSKGKLVTGALTGNLPMVLQGAAEVGIKNWIKKINSPDRMIKKMFEKASRV